MSEVNLIPNNDHNCGWGGNALGAGFGAFIGSMFGNGGWGNGWGNRGWGGPGVGAVEATTLAGNTQILNDLNDVRSQVSNLGMNLIQGQGRDALTACQGFGGLNTAILTSAANQTNWTNQGFAGLNNAVQQGMFGLNSQIANQGYETRDAINQLQAKQQDCCCTLRQEMANGFCAITQKLDQQTITALQSQLCDAKSKISSLESQQFLTASQLAQSQYLVSQLKPTTTA